MSKEYVYVAYGYDSYQGDACVFKVFATKELAIAYRKIVDFHMFIDKTEIVSNSLED